jgi:hypothetical protein
VVWLALAAIGSLSPARAHADFTPPMLLSGAGQIEFTEASSPAVSQDGRYVVFQGIIGEIAGVFRRDIETGEVEPVATTYAGEGSALGAPSEALSAEGAAPSVSAEGRYVAFTTGTDLNQAEEPSADRGYPEVWVRDMDKPPNEVGAYKLASAGIIFEPEPGEGAGAPSGAQAAPGVALSADGQRVVFTVLSRSNLDDGRPTPPSQVAVRDLKTNTTILVSATPEGGATPGGGAYPSTYSEAYFNRASGTTSIEGAFADQATASSAAISADGSTVAWLGTDVAAQTGEANMWENPGAEVEPLWRRVAGGPTKRLLAGAGLDFLYFPPEIEPERPVRSGALVSSDDQEFVPPVLSENGDTVALLANAPPPAGVASARLSLDPEAPDSDAFVVHVEDSTATPVVTPITTTPNYDAAPGAVGDITDIAISPNGTRVAFETDRTQIVSPSLALISPPNRYSRVFEPYEANLALGTLQRMIATYDGSEPDDQSALLSFSGDGQTLVFASQAVNLFYGDAVEASEIFVVDELASSTEVAPSLQELPPPATVPVPDWLLSATAEAQPDGEVTLDAQVPGAGTLAVSANAQLPRALSSRASRRGPRASHVVNKRGAAASGSKTKAAKQGHDGVVMQKRTVAHAAMVADGPAELELKMWVLSAFSALVSARTGLYAILRVAFTAPGHPTLFQDIPVTFRNVNKAGRDAKRASRSR